MVTPNTLPILLNFHCAASAGDGGTKELAAQLEPIVADTPTLRVSNTWTTGSEPVSAGMWVTTVIPSLSSGWASVMNGILQNRQNTVKRLVFAM
jgi:hypothetical protein